ncbi:MAG: hypothetical protein WD750_10970 [Gammaproteobacteria bacterium]
MYLSRYRTLFALLLVLSLAPGEARSEWTVAELEDIGQGEEAQVAFTDNEEGYSLEIYRDSVNAVRGRFTLAGELLAFAERSCATYQIDRGAPRNRSINNAPCLSTDRWSEYILGYIENRHIASSPLLAIMNGINIVFRFKLENGDYRTTSFSLQGSKRALTTVLGDDVNVGPD